MSFTDDETSRAALRAFAKLAAIADTDRELSHPLLECETAPAMFVVDTRNRVVYLNGHAATLMRRSAADVLGRTCAESVRCSTCGGECALLAGTAMSPRECVLEAGDGAGVPVLKRVQVLRDDAGAVVGGVEFLLDLTGLRERKETEASRRESRCALVSAALGTAVEGAAAAVVDGHGTIVLCTPAAAELLGLEPTAPSGVPLASLLTGELPWRACANAGGTGPPARCAVRTATGRVLRASFTSVTERRLAVPGVLVTFEESATDAPVSGPRHGIVGDSAPMRQLLKQIEALAAIDATVLVTGESGVGKELVARALHHAGPRSSRPFHAINCAALPSELLESELFGHERGAFTGAVREKPGQLELCEDGTLLLDEIGCMPLALQSKLLRVLEDGVLLRVGGTRTRQMGARVVAATNADLDDLVAQRSFRADLLYRLRVCRVRVPALRERQDDIPLLATHFAERLACATGTRFAGFSPATLRTLLDYDWPGNVRELRNVVQFALIVSQGRQIRCEHLPPEMTAGDEASVLDRARIQEALERTRFNRAEAAALLGVGRTTLWRLMKRHGIK